MNGVPSLPADVAKEFDCVKVIPGEVIWRNKTIDLTKIDLATAKQLEADKFPYLRKKVSSPAAPKASGL